MKMLAIDTSLTACSVAVLNTETNPAIQSMHQIAPMQQTRLILPMIQKLLDAASLSLKQLDAIAYGTGPGSFTGIRIASSVVQSLSFALEIPVICISSLAALAQTVYSKYNIKHILVAVDARVGQIYWANYVANPKNYVELIDQEIICFPHEINKTIFANNKIIRFGVGDAWEKYAAVLSKQLGIHYPPQIDTSLVPDAEAVLQLAKHKFQNQDSVTFNQALPVYLR